MTWRVARSLNDLLEQVNAAAPGRKKSRDGTVGDLAHQSRASRHNPNKAGVVTARDVTDDPDLLPIHKIVRVLIAHPEWIPNDLDYIISDRQVASREKDWTWRTYTGADDHVLHAHFGVGRGPDSNPVGPYDDPSNWHIADCLALLGQQEDSFMPALTDDEQRRLLGNIDRLAYASDHSVLPTLVAIAQKIDAGKVDPSAIAQAVIAGLDPAKIADAVAAALPADQAQRVADELAKRLAG